MSEGWIPDFREKAETDHEAPVTRELFRYILKHVQHQPYKSLRPGEGYFTPTDIREALHWKVGYRKQYYSMDQIDRALKRLCQLGMTAVTKAVHGRLIRVVNYERFGFPKTANAELPR